MFKDDLLTPGKGIDKFVQREIRVKTQKQESQSFDLESAVAEEACKAKRRSTVLMRDPEGVWMCNSKKNNNIVFIHSNNQNVIH